MSANIPDPNKTLKQIFIATISNRALLIATLMGIASGLPLLLTKSTLKTWLREDGIDLENIGLLSLAGIPYTLKFLWAPYLDHFSLSILGRRTSWLILSQVMLVIALCILSFLQPRADLSLIAFVAIFICFFSATQDIAVDAYRRETLSDQELGLGSSLYVYGYRIALWIARVVPLIVAQSYSWQAAYLTMAGLMSLNLITTWFAKEPIIEIDQRPANFADHFIFPLKDFFIRIGVKRAVLTLMFILFFKLGDSYASVMTSPFYIDIGFEKYEIALIDGSFGFFTQFLGLLLGSILIIRWGITKSLWYFGILQMISTAGFILLSQQGHNLTLFALVISFENTSAGMGTAAFLAYMASLTNKAYTATQYALMTSLMAVPLSFLSGTSGYLANYVGWTGFFTICTLAGIPGLILLRIIINPDLFKSIYSKRKKI